MSKKPHRIQTPDGKEFEIPVEGSLGLLALGDIGLMAWRSKIERVKGEMAARTRTNPDQEKSLRRDTEEAGEDTADEAGQDGTEADA